MRKQVQVIDSVQQGQVDRPGQQQIIQLVFDLQQRPKLKGMPLYDQVDIRTMTIISLGTRSIHNHTRYVRILPENLAYLLNGVNIFGQDAVVRLFGSRVDDTAIAALGTPSSSSAGINYSLPKRSIAVQYAGKVSKTPGP